MNAAEETEHVCALIRPLLAHRNPMIQSAVLADLLATWLAGYVANEDADALREQLLANHIELVKALIKPNEMALLHQAKRHAN